MTGCCWRGRTLRNLSCQQVFYIQSVGADHVGAEGERIAGASLGRTPATAPFVAQGRRRLPGPIPY